MNRRIRIRAPLVLAAALATAACDEANTHPAFESADKLPPLSQEDKQIIMDEDARIEAEERGVPVLPGKKKPSKSRSAAQRD